MQLFGKVASNCCQRVSSLITAGSCLSNYCSHL